MIKKFSTIKFPQYDILVFPKLKVNFYFKTKLFCEYPHQFAYAIIHAYKSINKS